MIVSIDNRSRQRRFQIWFSPLRFVVQRFILIQTNRSFSWSRLPTFRLRYMTLPSRIVWSYFDFILWSFCFRSTFTFTLLFILIYILFILKLYLFSFFLSLQRLDPSFGELKVLDLIFNYIITFRYYFTLLSLLSYLFLVFLGMLDACFYFLFFNSCHFGINWDIFDDFPRFNSIKLRSRAYLKLGDNRFFEIADKMSVRSIMLVKIGRSFTQPSAIDICVGMLKCWIHGLLSHFRSLVLADLILESFYPKLANNLLKNTDFLLQFLLLLKIYLFLWLTRDCTGYLIVDNGRLHWKLFFLFKVELQLGRLWSFVLLVDNRLELFFSLLDLTDDLKMLFCFRFLFFCPLEVYLLLFEATLCLFEGYVLFIFGREWKIHGLKLFIELS